MTVFPLESPTSSVSTPASSKSRAVIRSYDVSIVNFSPDSFHSRRWWVRTFLTVGAAPLPVEPAEAPPYGAGSSGVLLIVEPLVTSRGSLLESTDRRQR